MGQQKNIATYNTSNVQDQITPVADQTLSHFERVSTAADTYLAEARPVTLDVLASVNALSSPAQQRAISTVNQETRADLARLSAEPAIARVVVRDEADCLSTVFVARAAPSGLPAGDYLAASYRSPLGRLAALEVGDELEHASGAGEKVYTVVNRARLHPEKEHGQWDARNTVFESEDAGPLTIVSLRAALAALGVETSDLDVLDALLAEGQESRNVIDGLTRAVVEKMGLRDQAVLDRYQDTIFRLPLDTRLAILGPPGAGKTTTLIKRLGLKLDVGHLAEDERAGAARSAAGLEGHRSSWMMFTPTELLKQYVKEAFAREDVPASDLRIQTWTDYRLMLGKRDLGILRSGSGRGAILRDGLKSLLETTLTQQIEWFEDFRNWQSRFFWNDLHEHAKQLAGVPDTRIARLGGRLARTIPAVPDGEAAALLAIIALGQEISDIAIDLRRQVDEATRASLAAHVRQERDLLDRLNAFVASLGETADESDEADLEDDDEDEDEAQTRRGDREQAFEVYRRVTRTQARAVAQKRSISRRTRNGQILAWLGERTLSEADRRSLGEKLVIIKAMQRFSNPLRRYLAGTLARYRHFRRLRQSESRWYAPGPIPSLDLAPAEVDAVVLAMLNAGRILLRDRGIQAVSQSPGPLQSIKRVQKNQIVVDEATDFSPLELSCMAHLADPAFNALVLSGDFNQRITVVGARTEADLKWIAPDIDIRPITITYRHSRPLANLAGALVTLSGGEPLGARLPEHLVTDGFAPIIALGLDRTETIAWLADRIREIDVQLGGHLPSIAILVAEEDDVIPVAQALDESLAASNIPCTACPNGQVRGQDSEVRVFAVHHIKGLEFEAVFFLDIDRLAAQQPDLFDRFLYVGATRAATYLGLTATAQDLPGRLDTLSEHFRTEWVAP